MYGISERIIEKIVLEHVDDQKLFEKIQEKVSDYVNNGGFDTTEFTNMLKDYAKTEYVDGKIKDVEGLVEDLKKLVLGDDSKLVDAYDTLSEVGEWIEKHGEDAGNLVEKLNEIEDTLEEKADKTEIPSLEGYATESWVKGSYEKRVSDLEKKEDYDDSELKSDINKIKEDLKNYQPKGDYLTEHQDISNLVSKDDFKKVKDTVDTLENYDDTEITGEIKKLQDNKADKKDLENYQPKGNYLTEHQSLEDIKSRIETLESKEDYDDTEIKKEIKNLQDNKVDNSELEKYQPKGNYLTEHQDISNLATKQEVEDSKYDDSELKLSVNELNSKKINWEKNDKNIDSIVLPNFGMIIGEPNTGEVENMAPAKGNAPLIMLSKWNVIDLGSTKYPINLNGSKERPTYNDTLELALLSDIKEYDDTKLVNQISTLNINKADKSDIPSLEGYATETYVDGKVKEGIDKLVGGASETMDTLAELETAISGNKNIINTLNNAITLKANKSDVEDALELKSDKKSVEDALNTLTDYVDNNFQTKGDYLTVTVNKNNNNQKVTTFENNQILGAIPNTDYFDEYVQKTDKTWVGLIELNKWNVVDLGTPYLPLNINTPDGQRVTVQEKSQKGYEANVIAYLSDFKDYVKFEGPDMEGHGRHITMDNKDMLMGKVNPDYDKITTDQAYVSIAQISKYNCVDLGNYHLPMVLSVPAETRPIVDSKGTQTPVAIISDLENYQPKGNYPVYEWSEQEQKNSIRLKNNDNITGYTTEGADVNLVEVSKWNVADFGSKAVHINFNGKYERPTYNDKEGIAFLSDIEKMKTELTNHFNTLLKNYALKSNDELVTMLKGGGDVELLANVKSSKDVTLTKDTDIDLNGHTLDAVGGTYGDNVVVGNGADVTIKNGVIKQAEKATVDDLSAVIIVKTAYPTKLTLEDVEVEGYKPLFINNTSKDTLVTINSGDFKCTSEAGEVVFVQKGGKVVINGGYFSNPVATTYAGFMLNIKDDFRKTLSDPREAIEVRGGEFLNFDPANNKAEGEGTNFVADGYKSVPVETEEGILYKVVKDED